MTFEEGLLLTMEIQDRFRSERRPFKSVDGDNPYEIDDFAADPIDPDKE